MLHSHLSLLLAAFVFSHVIEGRVLDHGGQPVIGAHLWVSSQAARPETPDYEHVAGAMSSEGGRFELTLPPEWIEASGVLRDLTVVVWKEGHGAYRTNWAPDDVPAGVPFEPWLPILSSTKFTIEDELGEPYQNARVYPASLTYPDSSELRMASKGWDDTGMFPTDELGRVTLPFPGETIEQLIVATETGGRFDISWVDRSSGNFPSTLVLQRPTARRFEAEGPIAPSLQLSVIQYVSAPSFTARELLVGYTHTMTLEGPSPWELPVLGTPMSFSLESADASALSYAVEPVPPAQEGESPNAWRIEEPKNAGKVMGGAVLQPDGTPLPGVRLRLRTPSIGTVTTDEEGRFEAASTGAFVNVASAIPPDGFVFQGRVRGHAPADWETGLATLSPLALVPATWIQGSVTTEDGAAAPGAWITAAVQGKERSFQVMTAVANADGAFRIGPIAPDVYYELIGHAQGQVGKVVAQGGLESRDDVTHLTLAPALLARFNLAWTGPEPAPRARVTLVGEDALQYASYSGGVHSGGRLHHACAMNQEITLTRPLDAEGLYAIRYEGWSDADQRRMRAGITAFVPGKELAAGMTIVPNPRGVIPVAWPVETSGADGSVLRARMRTTDFWAPLNPEGGFSVVFGEHSPDILLVERDGIVEHATVLRSLPKRGSDALPFAEPSREPSRERSRERDAAQVAKIAWAKVEESMEGSGDEVVRWLQPLMKSDPDSVLAFLDSGRCKDADTASMALSMLAERLAPLRPDEALALVRREEIAHRRFFIAYLAAPKMKKEAALQELAGVLADTSQNSGPTSQITRAAFVAKGLFELGEPDAARTVLEPILEVAHGLPDNDRTSLAKMTLASAVYLQSQWQGLELFSVADRPSDQLRPMGHMAAWLALVDTDVCEEALTVLSRRQYAQFYIDRALPTAAYRTALHDSERAIEMVDTFAASAIPYGLIALALAERGQSDEAFEVLARAFDRVDADLASGGALRFHPVAPAAFLLAAAEVVDPAGFDHWRNRALAVPRQHAEDPAPYVEALINAEVCLAIVLADHSPSMARALLDPWIAALNGDEALAQKAAGKIKCIGAAIGLVYGDTMEAELQQVPDSLRESALRAAVQALARASEPRGKLLAALQILPAAWWPGERLR